jgi:hypothetical protein
MLITSLLLLLLFQLFNVKLILVLKKFVKNCSFFYNHNFNFLKSKFIMLISRLYDQINSSIYKFVVKFYSWGFLNDFYFTPNQIKITNYQW